MALSVKRFLPRTLFGRSLLILVTPVLLIQVITTFIFFDRHWGRVTTHLAFAVAGEISVLTQVLEGEHSDEKVSAVMGYADKYLNLKASFEPDMRLPDAKASSVTALWEGLVADKLSGELSAMLDQAFVVHTYFAHKQVEVFVEVNGGVLKATFPQRRLFSSSAYIFILWMMGTSLLLLIVAILFMRNQIRPIRKLSVAMARFGKGRDTPFFKPEGASEVRQAGAAYLDMRRRIERQISQRMDMLTGISHDLRTPLTRMKLQIEMIGDEADKAGMRQDIGDMEAMIHGYLDFIRGDGDEDFEEIGLNELFLKLGNNVKRQKPVNVHIQLPEGARVPGRPMAVERAFANIVNNAARYASDIWVSAARDGEKLQIRIEDNGPGIPPEMYEDVFKPFKRVDESRNADTGGVGLGLPIAMDIVHAHGGKIYLGQSVHGGLCVSIRLPLK